MRKRILSFILAIILVISALPVMTRAADTAPVFPLKGDTSKMYICTYGGSVARMNSDGSDWTHAHHGSYYYAMDISGTGATRGTPVYAVADGVVVYDDSAESPTYGELIIKHTVPLTLADGKTTYDTWYSTYVHMREKKFTVGDKVNRDQPIGEVSDVHPTGVPVHLHFSLTTKLYKGKYNYHYSSNHGTNPARGTLLDYAYATLNPKWVYPDKTLNVVPDPGDAADKEAVNRFKLGVEYAPGNSKNGTQYNEKYAEKCTVKAPYYTDVGVVSGSITTDDAKVEGICQNPSRIVLEQGGFYISTKPGAVENGKKFTDDVPASYQTRDKIECGYNFKNEYKYPLSPGTTYYYVLYMTDSGGKSYYSEEKSFKTEGTNVCKHESYETIPAEAPTCTESGLSEGRRCKNCGTVLTEQKVIPAKGHTEVIDKAEAATCTAPGKTEGKHCSVCNEVLVAQEEIEMREHTMDGGKVTKEPTEDAEGVKTYTCTVCDKTETEVIPKLEHVESPYYTDVDVVSDSITTDNAKVKGICQNPGGIVLEQGGFYISTKPGAVENGKKFTDDVPDSYQTAAEIPCGYNFKDEYKYPLSPGTTYYYVLYMIDSGGKPYYSEEKYFTTAAIGKYNADAAIEYAKAHWNDGKGLCAEFVVNCLQAGGLGIPDYVWTHEVLNWLESNGYQRVPLVGEINAYIHHNSFLEKDNTGLVQPGDVIFIVDSGKQETEDNPYHVVLASGFGKGKQGTENRVLCYSHNPAGSPGNLSGRLDMYARDVTGQKFGAFVIRMGSKAEEACKHESYETIPAEAPTCTESGLSEGRRCQNCGTVLAEQKVIPAKGHTEVIDKAEAATCTAPGKTEGKHCSVCNEVLVAQEEIEMREHTMDGGKVTKEPTEDAEGVKTYTCTGCGKTETEELPKLDHDHKYNEVITPPTCTEEGYTTYTCRCEDTYRDNWVEPLGHKWSDWVVTREPTEENEGTKTRNCTTCDERETESIPVLDHVHEYSKTVTPPTCTEEGYTTYTCRCEDAYQADWIEPLDHSWDDGVVTKEPTEEAEGLRTYTCTVCEETKTEEIPALEHKHEYTSVVTPPTCTEIGYTTHTCRCGDRYEDQLVAAIYHIWDEGKVTKAPTEEAEGVKTYTCTLCKETETETLPKLDHVHIYSESVTPPTCTEEGYTTYTCRCEDVYEDNFTEPVGHKWDKGIVTKEPTEETEGEKTQTCTACGITKTESIPTLEHVHNYTASVTPPMCELPGYTTHTCVCGDTYVDNETPPSGHDYFETVRPPTCTTEGHTMYTCHGCRARYVDHKVPPTGHIWDSGEVTKEATEETEGEKTYTCTVCEATKTEMTPKLNHVHRYTETVTPPTCVDEGYTTYTCACGETKLDNKVPAPGHKFEDGVCTVCDEKAPDYVKPTEPTEPEPTEPEPTEPEPTEPEPTEPEPTEPEPTEPEPTDPVAPTVDRISGGNRISTAIASANKLKEVLGVEKFQTIVVANAMDFPDALSGSYLAAVAKAPILLYANGQASVTEYIKTNLATGGIVYILGGEKSVSNELINKLPGISCARVAGSGRFATSLAIIEKADAIRGTKPDKVLICHALAFADSLSASATGLPILLVNGSGSLNDAQKAYLESVRGAELYAIGGEKTILPSLLEELNAYDANGAERIYGSGRELTSAAVARKFFPEATSVALASSLSFPDGLAGGPVAYAMNMPLLLTRENKESIAKDYVNSKGITEGYIIGGTSAVSDISANTVFGAGIR